MRQVITPRNIALVKAQLPDEEKEKVKPDNYKERILKFIPVEVVTLYLTVYGIAIAAKKEIPFEVITWVIFAVGIIGTLLYLRFVERVRGLSHIIISTLAFVVWVFALGGPFLHLSWYNPVYGAILLPIYTFFIPILVGVGGPILADR